MLASLVCKFVQTDYPSLALNRTISRTNGTNYFGPMAVFLKGGQSQMFETFLLKVSVLV